MQIKVNVTVPSEVNGFTRGCRWPLGQKTKLHTERCVPILLLGDGAVTVKSITKFSRNLSGEASLLSPFLVFPHNVSFYRFSNTH